MDPFSDIQTVEIRSNIALTPDLYRLSRFARFLIWLHVVLAVAVPLIGNMLITWVDWVGRKLFDMPGTSTGSSLFWLAPSIGLYLTMAFCAWRVYRRPDKDLSWMLPIIQTKAVAAASFLAFYFIDTRSLPYILATAFEAILFITCIVMWYMAERSIKESPVSIKETGDNQP